MNTNIIYRRLLIVVLICMSCVSCDKYYGPWTEIHDNISVRDTGNSQFAQVGEYLDSEIGIYVINYKTNINSGAKVQYEVVYGGGQVDQTTILSDESGKATTRWKLGDKPGKQELTVSVFNTENKIFLSHNLYAYALKPGVWIEVENSQWARASDFLSDPANSKTLMLSSGRLYKRKAKAFEWEELYLQGFSYQSFSQIEMDATGKYYIENFKGELFSSKNQGASWLACSKPWTENYSFRLFSTNNKYLWAYRVNEPLKYSTDEGQSWNTCNELGNTKEIIDIYSMNSGTIFLLERENGICSLFKSTDGATTWEKLDNNENIQRIFVTEDDELIKISNSIPTSGLSIHKSEDEAKNWEIKYSGSGYVNFHDKNIIVKSGNTYFIALQESTLLKTNNFETFETDTNIATTDKHYIREIFTDHEGNISAGGGWNYDKLYCRLKE